MKEDKEKQKKKEKKKNKKKKQKQKKKKRKRRRVHSAGVTGDASGGEFLRVLNIELRLQSVVNLLLNCVNPKGPTTLTLLSVYLRELG